MMLENLIPHGFLTNLHYPPQALNDLALKELYLALSEKHLYNQFELFGEGRGARLREGADRLLEIHRDRLFIKEQPARMTFEEYSQQATAMAQEIQRKLQIPIWIVQQSIIRFLIPMNEPVTPLLRNHVFALSDESLESFGRPVLGLCLRVELPPTPDDPTQMQLRVEPYFRDAQMIYLELTTRFLQPLPNTDGLEARHQTAYAFIREKACDFLMTSLSRKEP